MYYDFAITLSTVLGIKRWTAPRLPPLAPRISQIRHVALVEREAVTVPLHHAFSVELADVGPGCNRGAVPMPTRLRSQAILIAVER